MLPTIFAGIPRNEIFFGLAKPGGAVYPERRLSEGGTPEPTARLLETKNNPENPRQRAGGLPGQPQNIQTAVYFLFFGV